MDINRRVAYNTLLNMEKSGAYSNIELNREIDRYKPKEQGFVRELVYGVTRHIYTLDHIIDILVPKGAKSLKKQPLILLRMGLYQLIYMKSVPDYAAVNETVSLARRVAIGRDRFINGVLRGFLSERESLEPKLETSIEGLSTYYSFEKWIVENWIEEYGIDDAIELLEASNRTPKLSIRVNLKKTTKEELKIQLESREFEVEDCPLTGRGLFVRGSGLISNDLFKKGYFSVEDISSICAVDMMKIKPKDKVIDLCAAPGGKTGAIAELLDKDGRVYAFDIYPHKIKLVEEMKERLGISNIEAGIMDGTVFNKELEEKADKVLIDAVCSGLGVIRRKPEIKYKKIEDRGKNLAKIQLKLLQNGSKYLKKGGILAYTTCTINRKENSEVVSRFLGENQNFDLLESRQFLPNRDETDGFFVCLMKRRR